MRVVAASMGMKKQKVKRNLLVTEKKFNIDLKCILFHSLFFSTTRTWKNWGKRHVNNIYMFHPEGVKSCTGWRELRMDSLLLSCWGDLYLSLLNNHVLSNRAFTSSSFSLNIYVYHSYRWNLIPTATETSISKKRKWDFFCKIELTVLMCTTTMLIQLMKTSAKQAFLIHALLNFDFQKTVCFSRPLMELNWLEIHFLIFIVASFVPSCWRL